MNYTGDVPTSERWMKFWRNRFPRVTRPHGLLESYGRYPGVVMAERLDLSRPSSGYRTLLQSLVSFAGATGIALLVPIAILLIGLPVVLGVRGVLEAIGWVFGVALR